MIQRKRTRVESRKEVSLSWPAGTFRGELLNLSLKGGLFNGPKERFPKIGTEVAITIHLEPESPELDVQLKGRVVRIDKPIVAVDFFEVELDSFRHLLGLVQYNTLEPERIEQELSVPAFSLQTHSGKRKEAARSGRTKSQNPNSSGR
jgi:hypothetical protein